MNTQTNPVTSVEEALQHPENFRVSIFGSARTEPGHPVYQKVFDLAKRLAEENIGVVTGGGPGVMEAANLGHRAGASEHARSIGLTIELPWESEANEHLDMQKHFEKFSNRLDHFMALSHAVVIMPGGIGTCLELFYTWQLMQVKHTFPMPIILADPMWHHLLQWVKENPLKNGMISPEDMDNVFCTDHNDETMEIILETHRKVTDCGEKVCPVMKKYKPYDILEAGSDLSLSRD